MEAALRHVVPIRAPDVGRKANLAIECIATGYRYAEEDNTTVSNLKSCNGFPCAKPGALPGTELGKKYTLVRAPGSLFGIDGKEAGKPNQSRAMFSSK